MNLRPIGYEPTALTTELPPHATQLNRDEYISFISCRYRKLYNSAVNHMLPNINEKKLAEQIKRFTDIRVVGLIVFGFVVLLVSWSGLKVMQKNYELQKREAQLRQENDVAKLKNENQKLKNTYFESDQYAELQARRQFSKAAPGEKLYLIPEDVAMSKTVDLPKNETQIIEEKKQTHSKYILNLEAWREFLFHQKN